MPAHISEVHSFEPFPHHPVGKISAVRLVLIEENRAKADLLRFCCLHKWGFDVVACSHTGSEGIAATSRVAPDLIFAGIKSADMAIPPYIAALRAAAPAAKLILFSPYCNEYLVHIMKGLDYHGLVYEPDELLSSLALLIEKVRQGQRVVSPAISRLQAQLRAMPNAFPKLLSARHEEVLVCIAHSMTDDEIGRQLGFSTATALSHRQAIMKKLNVHSTPKLIRYCSDKGFNSVPPPTKS